MTKYFYTESDMKTLKIFTEVKNNILKLKEASLLLVS